MQDRPFGHEHLAQSGYCTGIVNSTSLRPAMAEFTSFSSAAWVPEHCDPDRGLNGFVIRLHHTRLAFARVDARGKAPSEYRNHNVCCANTPERLRLQF